MKNSATLETKILNSSINLVFHKLTESHPIHRHDQYFEIEYVTKGSGTVIINNVPREFTVGDAWFCSSTDFHETILNEDTDLTNISFKIDWIENELLNDLSCGTVIKEYFPAKINEFCREYKEERYGSAMYLRYLLNCILIDFIRTMHEHKTKDAYSKFSPIINQALRYIQSHFSENIALNDVAAAVGLSPNYLSTRFHNELKVSFQTYLVNIRLETAAKFLTSTGYSVTDICYISGFKDYVNFTKAFKKRYGQTPMQYRKENKH